MKGTHIKYKEPIQPMSHPFRLYWAYFRCSSYLDQTIKGEHIEESNKREGKIKDIFPVGAELQTNFVN